MDELKPLLQYEKESAYMPKYLSLRARQGQIPALMINNQWRTSKRA